MSSPRTNSPRTSSPRTPSLFDLMKTGSGKKYKEHHSKELTMTEKLVDLYDSNMAVRVATMVVFILSFIVIVIAISTYGDKTEDAILEKRDDSWSRTILFYRRDGGKALLAFAVIFMVLSLLFTGGSLYKIQKVLTAQPVGHHE